MDRCLEITPNEKIPYDYTLIRMAEIYYHGNQENKANTLVSDLSEITESKLAYYLDHNREFISSINDEIIYNFQVMQNLIALSSNFDQNDLLAALEEAYNQLYDLYLQKIRA